MNELCAKTHTNKPFIMNTNRVYTSLNNCFGKMVSPVCTCTISLKLNTIQLVTPVATTAVLWQMMYRIQDWFIHLLILNTI